MSDGMVGLRFPAGATDQSLCPVCQDLGHGTQSGVPGKTTTKNARPWWGRASKSLYNLLIFNN